MSVIVGDGDDGGGVGGGGGGLGALLTSRIWPKSDHFQHSMFY